MKKTITVFTPTYNRAYCLNKCYESLVRQTSKDFLWIIVDDGSTDNTREVVKNWQNRDNGFEIKYIYKENGGMYTGYNKAIELLDTELAVCIDSDDYMPDDAIELIVDFWKENNDKRFAGIVGLDYNKDGQMLGDNLPNIKAVSAIDLMVGKYKIDTGDCKYVVRSDLYKKYVPMPEIKGEKDYNPHVLHLKISQTHSFLVLNKNLCFVDYQVGGMTSEIFKQYFRSPKSYLLMRNFNLSLKNTPLLFRIKNSIHYVSSAYFCKDKDFIKKSPRKLLTVLAIPLGFLFSFYVKHKAKQ